MKTILAVQTYNKSNIHKQLEMIMRLKLIALVNCAETVARARRHGSANMLQVRNNCNSNTKQKKRAEKTRCFEKFRPPRVLYVAR